MTAPLLTRSAFKTSRLLDFCSERELVKQIGHDVHDWPLVIIKELIDNAIDAAEEARVAPVIMIELDRAEAAGDAIIVADNGPGISPETVTNILDFATRTSSREAYVSPTRGAQGQCTEDDPCHGLCAQRRSRPDRDREPGGGAPHHLSRRPGPAGAEDRACPGAIKSKNWDQGNGVLAGLCLLNA